MKIDSSAELRIAAVYGAMVAGASFHTKDESPGRFRRIVLHAWEFAHNAEAVLQEELQRLVNECDPTP